MKTTAFATRTEKEEAATEGVAMTIDPAAVNYITKALESLYTEPTLAALREYTSNAVDAHIAAAVTDVPVKITIDDYNLTIQDFGHGMSLDTLVEIYSRFGATTKRNTNTQVGGFGFGGKSALAFTDEFFIETINNGMLVNATVRRDSGQPGFLNPTEPAPTSQRSGTKIIIPLNKPKGSDADSSRIAVTRQARNGTFGSGEDTKHKLIEAIQQGFFSGYKPSQVTVNGHPVGSMTGGVVPSVYEQEFYLPVAAGEDELGWVRLMKARPARAYSYDYPNSYNNPTLYVGGVKYNFPTELTVESLLGRQSNNYRFYSRLISKHLHVSLNVPVGTVDIPASRENITNSPRTRRMLTTLLEELLSLLEPTAQTRLNSFQDRKEAFSWWMKASGMFTPIQVSGMDRNGYRIDRNTGEREETFGVSWKDVRFESHLKLDSAQPAMKKEIIVGPKSATGRKVMELDLLNDALVCWSNSGKITKAVVVTHPKGKYSEDDWKLARNNVEDYVAGKFNAVEYILYYVEEGLVPKSTLEDVYVLPTIEEMVEEGRKVRRDRRKKPTTRKQLTYMVFDPNAPKATWSKWGVSGSINAVDSEKIDESYAFISLGSKHGLNPFNDLLDAIRDSSKGSLSLSVHHASSLKTLAEGRKVVLLPSSRSSAALVKKNQNILDLNAVVEGILVEVMESEGVEAKLAAESYALASPGWRRNQDGGLKIIAPMIHNAKRIGDLSMVNSLRHLAENAVFVNDRRIAAFTLSFSQDALETRVGQVRGKLQTKFKDLNHLTIQDKLSAMMFSTSNQAQGPYQPLRESELVEIYVTLLNTMADLHVWKNYGE